MKVFLDTEFTGLHKDAELISIGMIAENGNTFYAEISGYRDPNDEWITENVISNLRFGNVYESNPVIDYEHHDMKSSKIGVSSALKEWLSQFDSVEIWGDCLSYDWVLFCDLFGGAKSVPENVSYIPFDICTLFQIRGIDPDINRESFIGQDADIKRHNALYDAKLCKRCYTKLMWEGKSE